MFVPRVTTQPVLAGTVPFLSTVPAGTMEGNRPSPPKCTTPPDAPAEQNSEEAEVILDQEAAPATCNSSPDVMPPPPTAGDDRRNFQDLFKQIADMF